MIIKVMTLMWTTMLEIDEELNDQDDNDDKGWDVYSNSGDDDNRDDDECDDEDKNNDNYSYDNDNDGGLEWVCVWTGSDTSWGPQESLSTVTDWLGHWWWWWWCNNDSDGVIKAPTLTM